MHVSMGKLKDKSKRQAMTYLLCRCLSQQLRGKPRSYNVLRAAGQEEFLAGNRH